MSPAKLIIMLAALVVVVSVTIIMLTTWGPHNRENETTLFYSRAYFYLINENGEPLENVRILLPSPNVDNTLPNREDYLKDAVWALYNYADNILVEQIRLGTVIQLKGMRTSELVIIDIGYGETNWGPKYGFEVDRLYPDEILEIRQWWEIPTSMADKLTLQDTSPYSPAALIYPEQAENIDASIFAGLYRIDENYVVKEVVEEFLGTGYNTPTQIWLQLAPVQQ